MLLLYLYRLAPASLPILTPQTTPFAHILPLCIKPRLHSLAEVENVAITRAEFLNVALEKAEEGLDSLSQADLTVVFKKAEEGFDSVSQAAEHATNMIIELGNVATTRAEYLTVALEKAEEGFDSFSQAAEHATDMFTVQNAYNGKEHY